MADDEATATEEGLDDLRGRGMGSRAADGSMQYAAYSEAGDAGEPCDAGASSPQPQLPGLEGLDQRPPAEAVRGPSGWLYHSTSIFCLLPHQFPVGFLSQ